MRRTRKAYCAALLPTKIGKISGKHFLDVSRVMADIRQMLSGIRFVSLAIKQLPISDQLQLVKIQQTLLEIRKSIIEIHDVSGNAHYLLIEFNQTLFIINTILFSESSAKTNDQLLN